MRNYHAYMPRIQAGDYNTVLYHTSTHTLVFQTHTMDEARTLQHALNACYTIDIREQENANPTNAPQNARTPTDA